MKKVTLSGTEYELNACPFCLKENDVSIVNDLTNKKWVKCYKCGALGPDGETVAKAVEAWNKAPRKRKTGRLEKLDKLYLSDGGYFKIEHIFDCGLEVYYLRPCPKCAVGKVEINHNPISSYVECQNCGHKTTARLNQREIIREWNRMADEEGKETNSPKKCPFCASNSTKYVDSFLDGDYVKCDNCGAKGPNEINRDRAYYMWNMRREKMPNE